MNFYLAYLLDLYYYHLLQKDSMKFHCDLHSQVYDYVHISKIKNHIYSTIFQQIAILLILHTLVRLDDVQLQFYMLILRYLLITFISSSKWWSYSNYIFQIRLSYICFQVLLFHHKPKSLYQYEQMWVFHFQHSLYDSKSNHQFSIHVFYYRTQLLPISYHNHDFLALHTNLICLD